MTGTASHEVLVEVGIHVYPVLREDGFELVDEDLKLGFGPATLEVVTLGEEGGREGKARNGGEGSMVVD